MSILAIIKDFYRRNSGLIWPIVIGQIIGQLIAEVIINW